MHKHIIFCPPARQKIIHYNLPLGEKIFDGKKVRFSLENLVLVYIFFPSTIPFDSTIRVHFFTLWAKFLFLELLIKSMIIFCPLFDVADFCLLKNFFLLPFKSSLLLAKLHYNIIIFIVLVPQSTVMLHVWDTSCQKFLHRTVRICTSKGNSVKSPPSDFIPKVF